MAILGRVSWTDREGRLGVAAFTWDGVRLMLDNGAAVDLQFLLDRDRAGAINWTNEAIRAWFHRELVPYLQSRPSMPPSPLAASSVGAPPVANPTQPLPVGVSSFSWGAFLFPFLWPLAYGLGGWALLGLLLNVFSPFSLPLAVWFGFAVNKAYWQRFPNRMSVIEFNRRQTKWIVTGLIIQGLYLLALVAALADM